MTSNSASEVVARSDVRDGMVEHHGVRVHFVEAGRGPVVLLVHGFPETWYSWRHQIAALADAGYRAVAIDVRGYGRSSAPAPIEAYRMTQHVNDNLAVVRALGEETATVVGHDWGAPIAWASAQLRPDVFTAVAGLSVPFSPSGRRRPTDAFADLGEAEEEFYISYFQQPGRAEAEIEPDVRGWLRGVFHSLSGPGMRQQADGGLPPVGLIGPGEGMSSRFVTPTSPPVWLTEADLDHYAAEFERTGLTGGLNRYRNVDRDWEDLAVVGDRPIDVPALFIAGEHDAPAITGRASIARFERTLPRLRGSHILPGCGHWVQQERPEEVNRLLREFLRTL